jgi:hypothetical protein
MFEKPSSIYLLATHYLSHQKEESWKIRTIKEIEDTLQGGKIVKFIKSLRLRW